MADMLRDAAAWLSGVLKANVAQTVTYRRGGLAVAWQASLGQSLLRTQDGRGNTKVERTDRDFIGPAADLAAGGVTMPPARGDVIDWDPGTGMERYELLPYGNEPLYRYEDPNGITLRVHTKRKGEP